MKKILLAAAITAMSFSGAFAQKYMTKSGQISFFSKTDMEDIEAKTNQTTSIINTATGEMVYKVLMKTFQFKQALMQEHFNEKYVESEKFPESTFKGKITNLSDIDFTKDGTYKVKVGGDMILHGVTKPVSAEGTITVSAGKITTVASFPVTLKDFNINVPGAVKDNIQETIQIKVDATYAAMK